MATFISVSGPSVTGKTSLIDSLCTYKEMSKCIFSPDFKDVVWNELIETGLFLEFTDITTDPGYMCTYMHRVLDRYNQYIEAHEDEDCVVILDECWLDYFIYTYLSMWYNRIISSAQEEVFDKILRYSNKISRYYITRAKDSQYPIDKFRVRGKITTFKMNRPLEIKLYDILSNMNGVVRLSTSDVSGNSLEVVEDLRKFGYL